MGSTIRVHEPLASWSTWKTGGSAEYFVSVKSEAELSEAIAYARANTLPITILGGGSNVLVADAGVGGLVVHIAITGQEIHEAGDDIFLTVGAGVLLDEVIAETVERGYSGLENLSHIPGTVGAAPVQNVGAYGVEIGDCISLVRVFDTILETFTSLSGADCQFAYRDSIFKHEAGARYIVTAVTFALSRKTVLQLSYKDLTNYFGERVPTLGEVRAAIIAIRSTKFPDWRTVGTAGSFFKNPIISRTQYEALLRTYPKLPMYDVDSVNVKIPLGWILDKVLNLKGAGTATVGCYSGQALVLYNRGGATTSDVVAFAHDIAARVQAVTTISIELEVRLLS